MNDCGIDKVYKFDQIKNGCGHIQLYSLQFNGFSYKKQENLWYVEIFGGRGGGDDQKQQILVWLNFNVIDLGKSIPLDYTIISNRIGQKYTISTWSRTYSLPATPNGVGQSLGTGGNVRA